MTGNTLKHAQSEATPLIDGDRVTFVWRGKQAPLLSGDFTDWERGQPIELQKTGRNTWSYTLGFPVDAYIEYTFIDRSDPKKRYPDPYNQQLIYNGLGDYNNFFYMPTAAPTLLTQRSKEAPRGMVRRYSVDTWYLVSGKTRSVYLYQPPVAEPVPLLIVWDGLDYLRRARLPTLLDNLISQGRLRPLALAMIHNGGKARTAEYGCSEGTLAFLLHKVIPLAQQNLNLIDIATHPGSFGVLGASMGGLMALYTALRLPKIFGNVLSQSGAFSLGDYDTLVYDLAGYPATPLPKIYLDVGIFDFRTLLTANRRMVQRLNQHNYEVAYREYPAGHNYTAWRNDLAGGLEWLFGG